MSPLALDATGRRPAFFDQDGVDQILAMTLELATELAVVKERLYVLERVAARSGMELTMGIESFTPNETEATQMADMRAKLTSNLFRTLSREHRATGPGIPDSEVSP
jgi:hypothetical protein